MFVFCGYFYLFLSFVVNGFGDEITKAQWQHSCKELGQNMQVIIDKLAEQNANANNDGPSSSVGPIIIQKVHNLKTISEQLAQRIERAMSSMLAPLIFEHVQKIGQFCGHLLITEGRENGDQMIRERLRNGIDQTKGRMYQIGRLISTILVEWDVWPLVYNFGVGVRTGDAFDEFVGQIGQRIGQMMEQISQNGSYYWNTSSSFEEALNKVRSVAMEGNKDEFRKYGKIWKIVQQLMIKASSEMLKNVTADLLGPSSKFYGTKILKEFGIPISFSDEICANAQVMFEGRKASFIEQIKNIAKIIHDQMKSYQIDLKNDATTRQNFNRTLNQVQNLFEIVQNELTMFDLRKSIEIIKEKMTILEQYKNRTDGISKNQDNEEEKATHSEEIFNCLNTEELEKSIEGEAEEMANFKLC